MIALVIGLFWVALSLVLSASPASATEPRSGLLGDVTDTLEDTAEETRGAVDAVVAPVVEPVKPVVENVTKPAQAVTAPVQAVTKPVVTEVVQPVARPVVTEVVEPVAKPVVREVVKPVADVVDRTVDGTGDLVIGVTDGTSDLLDDVLPLDRLTDPVAELPADLGGVLDGVLDETGDVVAELPGEVVELPGRVIDLPGGVVDVPGTIGDQPGVIVDGPDGEPLPGAVVPGRDGTNAVTRPGSSPATGLDVAAPMLAVPAPAQAPLGSAAPFRIATAIAVPLSSSAQHSVATLSDRAVQAPAGFASDGVAGGDVTDASAGSTAASGAPVAVTGAWASLRLLIDFSPVLADDELPTVPTFESVATPD
ncbi:hypothetical protein [Desertivibrio insolitus]|uniref:hypothetical protein n=1 Tax=Herbiconiux sp. SYSU D00978 TaxID=2812562 RepID=UPI001A9600D9|nr:hypothetical protein [Herbiconiux sp. SYSU D00978]